MQEKVPKKWKLHQASSHSDAVGSREGKLKSSLIPPCIWLLHVTIIISSSWFVSATWTKKKTVETRQAWQSIIKLKMGSQISIKRSASNSASLGLVVTIFHLSWDDVKFKHLNFADSSTSACSFLQMFSSGKWLLSNANKPKPYVDIDMWNDVLPGGRPEANYV